VARHTGVVLDKSRNEYLGLFALLFVAPQRRIYLVRLLFRASTAAKMAGVLVPGFVQRGPIERTATWK
jgi:hypothetical protein